MQNDLDTLKMLPKKVAISRLSEVKAQTEQTDRQTDVIERIISRIRGWYYLT